VTRPDATNTGPNNPGLLGTGTPPPDTITQNGATYENFVKNGCVKIEADNVTLRNFTINAGGCSSYGIRMENGTSGALIEYGEVDGQGSPAECLRGLGATIRYMNVHDCDDAHKAQGLNMGPLLVEHSYYWELVGGHGDAIQSLYKSNDVTFRYNHIVGGRTSAFKIDAAPDPGYEMVVQNNWINGDGQAYKLIYCGGYGEPVKFLDNLFGRNFKENSPIYKNGPCNWHNNYYWDDFSPLEHPSVWEP
jgi:hypothetical protein